VSAALSIVWDAATGRYLDPLTGRPVPPAQVQAALNALTNASADAARALYADVQAGRITVAAWQVQFAAELKQAHLAAAALGCGGFDQMTPADFGRVGGRLRQQYAYLNRFAAAYADGDPNATGGRGRVRADMYARAITTTYSEAERARARARGCTEERRIRGGTDTCPSCLRYAARGWVAIGTLPNIGAASECLTNCQCRFEYR
jgi:hypothetical protein